jgi:hypothetical protein
VQLLPEEQRPDFSAMLGGVQLQQVFLTLRSKTDRLVLKDASMTLTAGQAAIITSKEGCHQTRPCQDDIQCKYHCMVGATVVSTC